MPKYTALTPIEHDGKPYAEGEPITLTEDQAAPLLALKAVEPAPISKAEAARRAAEEEARRKAEAEAEAAAKAEAERLAAEEEARRKAAEGGAS